MSGLCDNCGIWDDNLEEHGGCGQEFCIGCWDKWYDDCPHCTYDVTPKEWTEL